MSAGCFVTGTDTGVGKTVATAAMIRALRGRGIKAAPMKPIAAGAELREQEWLNEDTAILLEAAGLAPHESPDVTPLLLREPIAPHIAAAREGREVDLQAVMHAYERLRSRADFVLVEGVGGFNVPLGPALDTVDLAQAFGLPVVLVVGLRLGCLNHALLTAQGIRAAGLPLAGWIANTIDPDMPVIEENVRALDERLHAPRLGWLPHSQPAEPAQLARHLDLSPLLS